MDEPVTLKTLCVKYRYSIDKVFNAVCNGELTNPIRNVPKPWTIRTYIAASTYNWAKKHRALHIWDRSNPDRGGRQDTRTTVPSRNLVE